MTFTDLESEKDSAVMGTSYTAFLLRCWQEETDGEPAWRFTLVQLGDKRSKQGFASLEAAVTFIRQILTESEPNPSGGKRS